MAIDPRILQLSYSSLLTLHSCPKKFQLAKLQSEADVTEDKAGSITFAYGHAVGSGIQHILQGQSSSEAIFKEFLAWDVDLFDENPKQNKSFWGAALALKQFEAMYDAGNLEGYELVYYNGKPAVELSFVIHCPDGFKFRGFVDAVLRHKVTGEVMVLECKTTNATSVNPAQYKNSAQAIGYSIVLDAIFPELSSYKVLYLVYQTKSECYAQLPFSKSHYNRALWIQELLLDIELIKMYEGADIYPMRGESCYSFFRECEYLNVCNLSVSRLVKSVTEEEVIEMQNKLDEFQIHISMEDLILAQLKHSAEPIPEVATTFVDGDELL